MRNKNKYVQDRGDVVMNFEFEGPLPPIMHGFLNGSSWSLGCWCVVAVGFVCLRGRWQMRDYGGRCELAHNFPHLFCLRGLWRSVCDINDGVWFERI